MIPGRQRRQQRRPDEAAARPDPPDHGADPETIAPGDDDGEVGRREAVGRCRQAGREDALREGAEGVDFAGKLLSLLYRRAVWRRAMRLCGI